MSKEEGLNLAEAVTPDADTRYQLFVSTAPLAKGELEESRLTTEVIVCWGDVGSVLSVNHIEADGQFVLGEEGETDFLMNAGLLGDTRFELVTDGRLRLPVGASGTVRINGEAQEFLGLEMSEGVEAFIQLGDFHFIVRGVRAGQKVADRGGTLDKPPFFFVGGAMAIAGVLLAMMSLVPPHGMALTMDNLDRESRLVSFAIDANALVEEELEFTNEPEAGGDEGGAERGDEGEMGDVDSPETNRAYGIEGQARPEDRQMARERAETAVQNSAVLGVLRNMAGAFNQPTSIYGADNAIGSDEASALGALTGNMIGDNHGYGGLGLMGTGRHAGGNGEGTIGLGEEGIGRGLGCDDDGPCLGGRNGASHGGPLHARAHRSRVPRMGTGRPSVHGALSAEVIRREVRRHNNEMKSCYQQALISNPSLEGRVTTRFMISPNGSVAAASIQSSTLHHSETERCIQSVIRRFTFPAPENSGIVSVTYPFSFVSN